ncbi:MAG: hypothetical protein M9913_01170 [Bryobacteraceae bacterium]|nr:hypothetical protein [Solibacteraceae bacterium]MCO5349516.1 hypothetical protein [Bryobacteraceae bacterium]
MKKLSRRALGGILAGAAVKGPVRGQEAAPEAPVDELARAREANRTQGRTLAEAAAKLAPETEPAFRFEA